MPAETTHLERAEALLRDASEPASEDRDYMGPWLGWRQKARALLADIAVPAPPPSTEKPRYAGNRPCPGCGHRIPLCHTHTCPDCGASLAPPPSAEPESALAQEPSLRQVAGEQAPASALSVEERLDALEAIGQGNANKQRADMGAFKKLQERIAELEAWRTEVTFAEERCLASIFQPTTSPVSPPSTEPEARDEGPTQTVDQRLHLLELAAVQQRKQIAELHWLLCQERDRRGGK